MGIVFARPPNKSNKTLATHLIELIALALVPH